MPEGDGVAARDAGGRWHRTRVAQALRDGARDQRPIAPERPPLTRIEEERYDPRERGGGGERPGEEDDREHPARFVEGESELPQSHDERRGRRRGGVVPRPRVGDEGIDVAAHRLHSRGGDATEVEVGGDALAERDERDAGGLPVDTRRNGPEHIEGDATTHVPHESHEIHRLAAVQPAPQREERRLDPLQQRRRAQRRHHVIQLAPEPLVRLSIHIAERRGAE